jgi:hypothetical protein
LPQAALTRKRADERPEDPQGGGVWMISGAIYGTNLAGLRLILVDLDQIRSEGCAMPHSKWTPRNVPYGADQTAYIVVDRYGEGCVYRETEMERTDLETVISDFLTGLFNDAIRVIAFNTLEHWSEDVSDEVAKEIQNRCDIEGAGLPEHVRDFVDRHTATTRQLSLRLA